MYVHIIQQPKYDQLSLVKALHTYTCTSAAAALNSKLRVD